MKTTEETIQFLIDANLLMRDLELPEDWQTGTIEQRHRIDQLLYAFNMNANYDSLPSSHNGESHHGAPCPVCKGRNTWYLRHYWGCYDCEMCLYDKL